MLYSNTVFGENGAKVNVIIIIIIIMTRINPIFLVVPAAINVHEALEKIWTNKMYFHSGYNVKELLSVVADLALLVDRQTRPSPLRVCWC